MAAMGDGGKRSFKIFKLTHSILHQGPTGHAPDEPVRSAARPSRSPCAAGQEPAQRHTGNAAECCPRTWQRTTGCVLDLGSTRRSRQQPSPEEPGGEVGKGSVLMNGCGCLWS